MNRAMILPLLAIPVVLLASGRSSAGSSNNCPFTSPFARDYNDESRKVYSLVSNVVNRYNLDPCWPLFMLERGYSESRFTPTAQNSSGAAGMFQLMPSTAFNSRTGLSHLLDGNARQRLYDPRLNTLLALEYYCHMAKRYVTVNHRQPTWLDVRRAGRYPSLVHDSNESNSQSASIRRHFEARLKAIQVPPKFMYRYIRNTSNWPGFQEVYKQYS